MKLNSENLFHAIGQVSDDKVLMSEENLIEEAPAVFKPLRWQFTGLIAAALILVAGTVFMLHSLAPDEEKPSATTTTTTTTTTTVGDAHPGVPTDATHTTTAPIAITTTPIPTGTDGRTMFAPTTTTTTPPRTTTGGLPHIVTASGNDSSTPTTVTTSPTRTTRPPNPSATTPPRTTPTPPRTTTAITTRLPGTTTPPTTTPSQPAVSMPKALQDQILTHWLANTYGEKPVYDGTNARISLYFGNFSGTEVFVIDSIFRGVPPVYTNTWGNVKLDFGGYGNRIMAWKDGEVKMLYTNSWAAYESGWLTYQDLQAIDEITKTTPLPRHMLLEGLPTATENRMVEDFRKMNGLPKDDYVYVANFLGIYNGKVAVIMDGPFGYATIVVQETVAGITFSYPHAGPYIMIWDNGEFHRLASWQEYNGSGFTEVKGAFDLGLVTSDNVREIHKRYLRGWNIFGED